MVVLQDYGNILFRHISGGDINPQEVLRFCPHIEKFDVDFNYTTLEIRGKNAKINFVFEDINTLRIKSLNAGLTLRFFSSSYDYLIKRKENFYEFNLSVNNVILGIYIIKGKIEAYFNWNGLFSEDPFIELNPENNILDFIIVDLSDLPKDCLFWNSNFDEVVNNREKDFNNFLNKFNFPFIHRKIKEATYLLWINAVSPRGLLKYEAIYSSKNKMTNIWSWDNLFSLLPLVEVDNNLALNQIRVFAALQRENGQIPDFINDIYCSYNFCKPPIMGYIFKYLCNKKNIDLSVFNEFYEMLKCWTLWWINYRDDDEDGLIQYNHGNESGWDNSTFFKDTIPIESPDINSYLITQLQFLIDLAKNLGKYEDISFYRDLIERLFCGLMRMYTNKGFIGYDICHNTIYSKTLQKYLPLILSERLPFKSIKTMVNELKSEYLVKWGLTTESVYSEYFNPEGYWRGPIWAPISFIFATSLSELGYNDLSNYIKKTFIKLNLKNNFEENFEPFKGQGLCDFGFSWTAAVFLEFILEFIKEGKEDELYEIMGELQD